MLIILSFHVIFTVRCTVINKICDNAIDKSVKEIIVKTMGST